MGNTEILNRVIAIILKGHIIRNNMGIREFENKIGWVNGYLSRIKKSNRNITIPNICKALELLNINPADFWKEVSEEIRKIEKKGE